MRVTILRVSGEQETHELPRGDLAGIKKLIGCDTIDTVVLSRDAEGARTLMLVDDDGYEIELKERSVPGYTFAMERVPTRPKKPVNVEATRRYHAICHPGTTHQIVGDVAIVDDRDFR